MRLSCGMSLIRWFGIIKQLLPLGEVDMTICSPSTGCFVFGLHPRAILPASGVTLTQGQQMYNMTY